MNVALGVTLLLGGLVSADIRLVADTQSSLRVADSGSVAANSREPRSMPSEDTDADSEEMPRAERSQRRSSSAEEAYQQPRLMPVAPTDISAQNAGGYPLLTPTEQPQVAIPRSYVAQPAAMPTQSGGLMRRTAMPTAPSDVRRERHYGQADRYGRQPQDVGSYVEHRIAQTESQALEYYAPSPSAVRAAVVRSRKPFTNVRQSPAISPYLNLYRLDNEGGTIDNYATLVRPEVRQLDTNGRFGGEIRSLENRNIIQGAAIGRLSSTTRRMQGRPSRDYYMNLLNFFPGYQR